MQKNNCPSICVYAASSPEVDAVYFQTASEIGNRLAEKGYGIINGAGNTGLMQAVSDAALQNNGRVTGIILRFMVERRWCHPHLTQLIQVESMHQRKQLMADQSKGVIALPGGCGTLEEILEIITWKQLELYHYPVIILNINGFYDPLLLQLKKATEEKFMKLSPAPLWQEARTPEEAVSYVCAIPDLYVQLPKLTPA